MYGKKQAIEEILDFIDSEDRSLLLTGTNQYNKHKLVMSVLDQHFPNARKLFRTNSMQNVSNFDFLGFVGIKNNMKAGKKVGIHNCIYEIDSFNSIRTLSKTSSHFDFAIFYPLDAIMRTEKFESLKFCLTLRIYLKYFLFHVTIRKNMITRS